MSGSVDDYHFQWCPRDDPDFRRLNNPVCICGALSDAMHEATHEVLADLRAKVIEMRDFWQTYLDADPTEKERDLAWSRVDALNGVLALFEEAQP